MFSHKNVAIRERCERRCHDAAARRLLFGSFFYSYDVLCIDVFCFWVWVDFGGHIHNDMV